MTEEVVVLRGGVVVRVEAIKKALDLEERGVTMRVEGRELILRPRALVTAADVVIIKRLLVDLKTIAIYQVAEI